MVRSRIGCVIIQIDWLCGILSKRMVSASRLASGLSLLAAMPGSQCAQVHAFLSLIQTVIDTL